MIKEPMWRLKADMGKLITDGGERTGPVIDCAPNVNPDIFYEIDDPDYKPEEQLEKEEG